MIARLLTALTARWDAVVAFCDVDRQLSRWPDVTHEPLPGEEDQ